MIFKDYKGTTPKYNATLYNSSGSVINPSSSFIKVIIKIYNILTGELFIGYTSESPIPDDLVDYYNCTLSSTAISWAIPSELTAEADPGENRVEIWTYKTDSDIPDENVAIECYSGMLNEFIDTQFED